MEISCMCVGPCNIFHCIKALYFIKFLNNCNYVLGKIEDDTAGQRKYHSQECSSDERASSQSVGPTIRVHLLSQLADCACPLVIENNQIHNDVNLFPLYSVEYTCIELLI